MITSRPRVGQTATDGKKTGTIIGIMDAPSVLRGMEEDPALLFGMTLQQRLGRDWLKLYFRIALELEPGVIEWFDGIDLDLLEE